jgi:anaerobic magnesium-protoporphyrin IX monomethyl ester cyclase
MGVLYLVDALRQAGFHSEIVSSDIAVAEFSRLIETVRPTVVGMSVLTAPQVGDFERLSTLVKEKYPTIKVVWGGVHATILAEECLRSSYIDYVFVGQGEVVFPELIRDIVDGTGKFPRKVNGYSPKNLDQFSPSWSQAGRLSRFIFSERHSVRSPQSRVLKTTSHLVSEIHEYVCSVDASLTPNTAKKVVNEIEKWDVGLYELEKVIFYYLLTSRGCPYKCTFCSEPLQKMNGSKEGKFFWNAHSLEWVKAQIAEIRELLSEEGETLDGVGLWDDMFWVKYKSRSRAFDILEYLASENLVYLIEARADQLIGDNFALFKKLGETNCAQVFIGAEAISQQTLDRIRKGTKALDYYRLMEVANSVQVPLRMSFIIGFPEESEESVNQTLDFCDSVESGKYGEWVNVSGPKIFTPYPGTVEFDRAVRCGFVLPRSHVEWGRINRSTEEYLDCFPWFRSYSNRTLDRLAVHFGKGQKVLGSH